MAEMDGQEKTEQPTSKKLSDARSRGRVAKSSEINSLVVLGAGMTMLYLTRSLLGSKMAGFAADTFRSLDGLNLTKTVLQTYFLKWALFFFGLILPVIAVILVASVISNVSQIGFKLSPKVFKPSLYKFNPVSGIKRLLFSSRSYVELGKSLFKFVIIGLFTYYVISDSILKTSLYVQLETTQMLAMMLDNAFDLIWKIVLFYSFIAAADFVFQRVKFKKEMMMTKQEVKEEYRQTEGDPHVKSKIKQKQFAMAKNRMMKEIPTADVVITNPTHVAVALKYNMGKDGAPKVVAKGLDELAQRIKKIAVENNVPLYEDVELARTLYKTCDIGDEIPAKLFKAVAQVLAYIYQLKRLKKRKSIV